MSTSYTFYKRNSFNLRSAYSLVLELSTVLHCHYKQIAFAKLSWNCRWSKLSWFWGFIIFAFFTKVASIMGHICIQGFIFCFCFFGDSVCLSLTSLVKWRNVFVSDNCCGIAAHPHLLQRALIAAINLTIFNLVHTSSTVLINTTD